MKKIFESEHTHWGMGLEVECPHCLSVMEIQNMWEIESRLSSEWFDVRCFKCERRFTVYKSQHLECIKRYSKEAMIS